MGQPWGLTGPEFLGLYIAGMVATVQISRGWCTLVALTAGRAASRELDPAEVGYLAGGPQRAAEVIVAGLVESGAWRVSSAGLLTPASYAGEPNGLGGPNVGGPYWLDVEPSTTGRTATIRRRLRRGTAVARIKRELQAEGLVPSRSHIAVMWAGTAAVYLALLSAGVLRVREGTSNHRPVADLIVLLVIALILIPFLLRQKVVRAARATRSGRRYVRRLRRGTIGQFDHAAPVGLAMAGTADVALGAVPRAPGSAQSAAPGWGTAGTGMGTAVRAGLVGVALVGFAGVTDVMTRQALLAGLSSPSSGSSGGGCSSGGCGGGCGGGGCGG